MPFAVEAWSKCVGTEEKTAGAIHDKIDLSSLEYSLPGETTGFDDEHSAEFERTVQVLQPFYRTLVEKLKVRHTGEP
jgi:hypothetical protein